MVKPFANKTDTFMAVACKVALIVAMVEQPRPLLAFIIITLFALMHLGSLGLKCYTKIKELR